MKVKELIKELKSINSDAEVFVEFEKDFAIWVNEDKDQIFLEKYEEGE